MECGGTGRQRFYFLFHQAIVKTHELGVLVVFEDELAGPHFGFFAQENLGSQVALQFIESRSNVGVGVNGGRRGAGARVARLIARSAGR